MAVKQLDDGRWICYWKEKKEDGGKNKRKYFRGPEAEAAAWAYHFSLGLKRRRPPKKYVQEGPDIHDLITRYSRAKPFSNNSKKCLDRRIDNIEDEMGRISALALTDNIVDQYVEKRLNTVKATTVHRELSDLQAVLNWAASRKPPLIPYNPIAGYKKPKRDDQVILPPTRSETDKILTHSPPHLFKAIVMTYYTGIRPGVELYGLMRHDIDLENNIILVRSAQKGGLAQRHVPIMHEEFKEILGLWLREDPSLYVINYRGNLLKSVKKAFKTAKTKAGITRRLRLYDFRHLFATLALKGGADLKAVSEIVGHTRPDITARIYQHVDLAMHQEAVSKVPSLKLLPKKA